MMHLIVIALIVLVVATLMVFTGLVAVNIALFVTLRSRMPQRPYPFPGG